MKQLNTIKTHKSKTTHTGDLILFALGIALCILTSCGVKSSQNSESGLLDPIACGNNFEPLSDEQMQALLNESQGLIEFDLIDTNLNRAVAGYENLQNEQVLNLAELPAQLSIEVRAHVSLNSKSVRIALGTLRRIENDAPYTIFGDSRGEYNSGELPLGETNLVASSHSERCAKGNVLALAQIKLNIMNDSDGGSTNGGETNGGETNGGETNGGETNGGETNGGESSSSESSSTGGIPEEANGIVKIEAESLTPSNSNWKIQNTDGRAHIVWRGGRYDNTSIGNVPSSARLNYVFKVNNGGTFKLVLHSRREARGRPLPPAGSQCNGLGGNQELCIDLENDIYVGLNGIQNPEKVYMNVAYYNDPTRMQIFPYDEWVSGGRVDRPNRTIPYYTFPRAGEYTLRVLPRSQNFLVDAFELIRINDGGGSSSSTSSSSISSSSSSTSISSSSSSSVNSSSSSVGSGNSTIQSPRGSVVSDALTKGFIRYNRSYNGGSNGARDGGASLVLATAAFSGNVPSPASLASVDNRLLEQVRYTLTGGNEPMANGGYPAQHESQVTSMMVLVKNTPRVYARLSADEKSKMDTLMKAILIASAHTTADGSRSYGMDGDSNIYRDGNSNYREGMVGGLLIGVAYLGVDAANSFMSNYNHAAFLEEIRQSGLTNIYSTWTWNVKSETSGRGPWIKPSASEIETNVRSYRYKTHSIQRYMRIYQQLLYHTMGKNVACGINHASGCGEIAKGCTGLPNKGALGMVQEFDTGSGGGRRSSSLYATDSLKAHQANRLALIASGLWNQDISVQQIAKTRVNIAVQDLRYKLEQGYKDLSNGKCTSGGTRTINTTVGNYNVGVKFSLALWEDSLRAYDNNGSGGGNTSSESSGGGSTSSESSASSSSVSSASSSSVSSASSTSSEPSSGGTTPISGVAAPEAAVDGKPWCYANRNNWDVIPNAHVKRNVGATSPESALIDFKTKYPGDFSMSGSKVVITKGNKVYSGFKTTYGIDIKASNVTLRNFVVSLGGVKVLSDTSTNPTTKALEYTYKNIVLEDGEIRRTNNFDLITDGSGVGLLGANWSAYRVYIHGFGDAVRTEGNNILAYSLTRRLGPGPKDHADMAQSITRSGKPPIKNVVFFRNFFLHMQSEDVKFYPSDKRNGKMNNVLNLMGEWKAYDNIFYSQSFIASGSGTKFGSHIFNNCLKTDGRNAYGASAWDPANWHHNINLNTGNFINLRGETTSERL